MKKIVIILVVFYLSLQATSLEKISLREYAKIVSNATSKNIFLDKDLENRNIYFYLPKNLPISDYLKSFKLSLKKHDYYLDDRGSFLVVSALLHKYYAYKFKNISISDIGNVLQFYFKNDYSVSSASNSVFFTSKQSFKDSLAFLKSIDLKRPHKRIKLTIISTDISKLKDIGSDIQSFQADLSNVFDLISNNSGTNLVFNSSNKLNFFTVLKYLEDNHISKIIQSPVILLTDNKKATFKSVKNVPFKISTEQISDNQTRNIESIEYRDVGLVLDMVPKINKDYLNLDLTLKIEDLIDSNLNTPVTSKIELLNSFDLNKDDVLFLTGFNKTIDSKTTTKVPLLGDIPVLKYLFSWNSESSSDFVLSILIEQI